MITWEWYVIHLLASDILGYSSFSLEITWSHSTVGEPFLQETMRPPKDFLWQTNGVRAGKHKIKVTGSDMMDESARWRERWEEVLTNERLANHQPKTRTRLQLSIYHRRRPWDLPCCSTHWFAAKFLCPYSQEKIVSLLTWIQISRKYRGEHTKYVARKCSKGE